MMKNTHVMLSISVLVGSLMSLAMPSDGWPQGLLGGATGSLDKAKQELQQLGAAAAQHAKKAAQAALDDARELGGCAARRTYPPDERDADIAIIVDTGGGKVLGRR